MDTQQLASKVAQLESRVATVEDEGKIVKGEVKQILTEIRSAILVRDNPFEGDGGMSGGSFGLGVTVANAPAARAPEPEPAPAPAPPPPAPKAPQPEPERPVAPPEPAAQPEPMPAREPVMLRPHAPEPAPTRQIAGPPQWTLLTIAGLSAWAEEAMGRIGALRLEILLDLCEASGQLSPDARKALARVTELDIAEPAETPSTNETAAMLRQLDALLNDQDDERPARLRRAG